MIKVEMNGTRTKLEVNGSAINLVSEWGYVALDIMKKMIAEGMDRDEVIQFFQHGFDAAKHALTISEALDDAVEDDDSDDDEDKLDKLLSALQTLKELKES